MGLHVADVGVYFVILNLATLLVPQVITESIAMSLLTSLMLKAVLEAVLVVKKRVKHRFRTAQTKAGKAAAALGLWAVLAGSKFVVLELEALLFGDAVNLGGFFSVTGLVIVLMLARGGTRALLTVQEPDSAS